MHLHNMPHDDDELFSKVGWEGYNTKLLEKANILTFAYVGILRDLYNL